MCSYHFKPQRALTQYVFFFFMESVSYFWTTITLKKKRLKREIVLLLTFSCNWVQCFISHNPNTPSLAMHHRAGENFALSWLQMRSTAVPRWTKVTDEPGWTTWQSGAGMDWKWENTREAHRHEASLLPSLYDSEKYWIVSVNVLYEYFCMVLRHVATFLTSFLQGSQNPFLGVHHWKWWLKGTRLSLMQFTSIQNSSSSVLVHDDPH